MVTTKFFPDQLQKLLRSPDEVVSRELLRRTIKVHGTARDLVAVRTGRLRSSIRFSMKEDSRGIFGQVGTDVEYAIYVHEGTRPHVINPRIANALFWKGASHPVRSVNHPGTRPVPFLVKALEAAV